MAKENNKDIKTKVDENKETLFDINKARLKLVIICSSEKNFEMPVYYLRRRGWQVFVTSDIKDAFKQISLLNPNFIMISVSIKSNQLGKLPKIIKQNFKLPVILFGENTDTLSLKLMQDTSADYKLNGKVSGPSIHRSIKNILSEISTSDDPEKRRIYLEIVNTIKQNTLPEMKEKKKQKKGYTFTIEENVTEEKKYPVFSEEPEQDNYNKESYDLEEEKHLTISNDNERVGVDVIDEDEKDLGIGLENKNEGLNEKGSELTHIRTSNEQADEFKIISSDREAGDIGEIQIHDGAANEVGKTVKLNEFTRNKSDMAKSETEILTGKENKEEIFDGFEDLLSVDKKSIKIQNDNDLDEQSLTVKKTIEQHYLIKIAEKILERNMTPLGAENQLSCSTLWTIKNKTSSYLVLVQVLSKTENLNKFIKLFENKMKDFYRDYDNSTEVLDKIEIQEELDIFVKVDGEVYTHQLKNSDCIVNIKYLQAKERNPNLRKAQFTNKFKIEGDDLVQGLPSGANVFIYLPNNDKLIRYLDEATLVNEKQKDTIEKHDSFIPVEDGPNYKRAYIRNKAIENIFTKKNKSKKSA